MFSALETWPEDQRRYELLNMIAVLLTSLIGCTFHGNITNVLETSPKNVLSIFHNISPLLSTQVFDNISRTLSWLSSRHGMSSALTRVSDNGAIPTNLISYDSHPSTGPFIAFFGKS